MPLARGTHSFFLLFFVGLCSSSTPRLWSLPSSPPRPLFYATQLCPFFTAADATSFFTTAVVPFCSRCRRHAIFLPPPSSPVSLAGMRCQASHRHVLRQADNPWRHGASKGHRARSRVDGAAVWRSGRQIMEG